MQFFSVLLMAASVAAVALPGNDWNQWSSSKCPEASTVYKTEYSTVYATQTDYKTDYKTEYQTQYSTEYKTEYQTKTETQYATITKECEKQQQTWGNWGGKSQ